MHHASLERLVPPPNDILKHTLCQVKERPLEIACSSATRLIRRFV
jgi:hypothetical protein